MQSNPQPSHQDNYGDPDAKQSAPPGYVYQPRSLTDEIGATALNAYQKPKPATDQIQTQPTPSSPAQAQVTEPTPYSQTQTPPASHQTRDQEPSQTQTFQPQPADTQPSQPAPTTNQAQPTQNQTDQQMPPQQQVFHPQTDHPQTQPASSAASQPQAAPDQTQPPTRPQPTNNQIPEPSSSQAAKDNLAKQNPLSSQAEPQTSQQQPPPPSPAEDKFGSFQMPQPQPQATQSQPVQSPQKQPAHQSQPANLASSMQPAYAGHNAPAGGQTAAARRPTPSNPWEQIKSSFIHFFSPHDAPHLPSKLRPIAMAAGAATVIFLLFNSQVILGQIQYLTNSGSGQTAPAAAPASNNQAAVSAKPKIIIPKINVNAPVVYDVKTFNENAVQKALERGVVHYGTTAVPGENGNNVIVGHSSNNWWASGKYKFAFVLLDKLEKGDTFVLHYKSQKYIYEVFDKKIVEPTNTKVLKQTDRPITTLITCTPPGTSWRRLVVQAEQISPDPSQNQGPSQDSNTSRQVQELASDSDTFFDRIKEWLFPDDGFSVEE